MFSHVSNANPTCTQSVSWMFTWLWSLNEHAVRVASAGWFSVSIAVGEQQVLHSKCNVLWWARGTFRGNASFCASSGEGTNLLSSPLGSKYRTLSPVRLVGIRPQDLVDILHILWFLFCQDAHCFCEARGEGKARNIQNSLQSHLWEHLWVSLSVYKLACVVLGRLGHWLLLRSWLSWK